MPDVSVAPILKVNNLTVDFPHDNGSSTRAVNQLNLQLYHGKTLALVGESGSGKSVSSMAIMRLLDYTPAQVSSGSIIFQPSKPPAIDLLSLSIDQMRTIRGHRIAMIYQEPMTSLDPVFSIGEQMREVLCHHLRLSHAKAHLRAIEWLRKVRLPDAEGLMQRYPHELSGGMRQRVMIAMALCCEPEILIADEPTTALDVTIQAQILQLIRQLQSELNMAVLFITHDMGVVAQMADDVMVMRHGEVLEQGTVAQIFARPKHPYTQSLLQAVPQIGQMKGQSEPRYFPLIEADADVTFPPLKSPDWKAPILELKGVTTRFTVNKRWWGKPTHQVFAAELVSFQLYPGETLALVGESGSGKSTIGRMIQQLVPIESGELYFRGKALSKMSRAEKESLQQRIQYIFQDHFASLDPRRTVFQSIVEPMEAHGLHQGQTSQRVNELLAQVGLAAEFAHRYPHEMSGGQRARVCIARALACEPEIIIADESIAALDVSIQAQILNLMMALQANLGLSFLFITHDMAVVEQISHRVAVLYLGQIVEYGSRAQIFESPMHPYTQKLLDAVPIADPTHIVERTFVDEEIPSPIRSVDNPPVPMRLQFVAPEHWVVQNSKEGSLC